MDAVKKFGNVGLLAACCVVPAISLGAPCAGTNINTRFSWEPTEIEKGTTLATWRATSVVVSDNPNAKNHLVIGECVGSFLITPDGNTQASGNCSRKDKDGDVLNEEWVQPAGTENKGTWKNVGGTGKFANAADTGEWEVVVLEKGKAAVRWVGDCQ